MKKFLNWLGYTIVGILCLMTLIYIGGSIYIKQNKKELIAEASKNIEEKYHSIVLIKDINLSLFAQFPNLSIQLKEIDVQGPMYKIHQQKLFKAENISVRIKFLPLLIGSLKFSKTKIENGQVYLYTDSTGKNNLSEFNQKKGEKKTVSLPELIELNNFEVIINDQKKKKFFDFFLNKIDIKTKELNNVLNLEIKKDIVVKSLTFNQRKGSFLKNQPIKGNYAVSLNKTTNKLVIPKIKLNIGGNDFIIDAIFNLQKEGLFKISIQANKIPFQFAKNILTGNINRVLNHIVITEPLNVDASISGPLSGGEPHVIANWNTKNTTIGTNQIKFTKATVIGTFNNQVNDQQEPDDSNSIISLNTLKGNWHDIPISTNNIILSNLTEPKIKGGFSSSFSLSKLNPPLNTENVLLKKGMAKIELAFEGPLINISESNTSLKGLLNIQNGHLLIKPIKKEIINTHANIEINNNTIYIKQLTASTIEGSQLNITGVSKHTLAAIPGTPGKAEVVLNLSSPLLDMNNFSSSLNHKTEKRKKKTFSKIDHILENEIINIYINAKRIKWNKINTNNVRGHIELNAGNWNLKNLSMNLGQGSVGISTTMKSNQNYKTVSASYTLNNIRVEDLLYGFDNFNLKNLSHKNLKAAINLSGKLETKLNDLGSINPADLQANIAFELKNGALINYDPLIKLQDHVFKKRQLDSLKFATIKNEITINKGNIHIPRMEIATSAMNLFIGGDYALNGNTNLHIQVPLNNITKRDQTAKMKSASNKDKGGTSVFLRAVSEPNGKVKLKLDPKGGQYKRAQLAQ